MRQDPAPQPSDDSPDRTADAVATVMVVHDGHSSSTTGLVIDDDGHVLVRADALDGADEIWARCSDGEVQAASIVGDDSSENLAVLRLEMPAGRPPSMSAKVPEPGAELFSVGAVDGDVLTTSAMVRAQPAPAHMFHAELSDRDAPDDSIFFDDRGRVTGLAMETPSTAPRVTTVSSAADEVVVVPVRSAEAAMDVAARLISQGG